jgi:hypothetical protein
LVRAHGFNSNPDTVGEQKGRGLPML